MRLFLKESHRAREHGPRWTGDTVVVWLLCVSVVCAGRAVEHPALRFGPEASRRKERSRQRQLAKLVVRLFGQT